MVICSCRAILESEVRRKLKEDPDTSVKEIIICNKEVRCCDKCRECMAAVQEIIATHSANIKRS